MAEDQSKLILEYLKTLTWPLVVLVVIVAFYKPLYNFIERLHSAKFGPVELNGTGNGEDKKDQDAPDVWFNLTKTSLSRTECIRYGRQALERSGYKDVVEKPAIIYGYDSKYVALVWCEQSNQQSMLLVSGPSSAGAAERQGQLAKAFNPTLR